MEIFLFIFKYFSHHIIKVNFLVVAKINPNGYQVLNLFRTLTLLWKFIT